jgi:hypothetical protein
MVPETCPAHDPTGIGIAKLPNASDICTVNTFMAGKDAKVPSVVKSTVKDAPAQKGLPFIIPVVMVSKKILSDDFLMA